MKAVSGLKKDICCNWHCSFGFITKYEGDDQRGVQTLTFCGEITVYLMIITLASAFLLFESRNPKISGNCIWHTQAAASDSSGVKTLVVRVYGYKYKGNVSCIHKMLHEFKWHCMNGTLCLKHSTLQFLCCFKLEQYKYLQREALSSRTEITLILLSLLKYLR